MLHFLGAPQHSLYVFIVKYTTCKTSWVTWSGITQRFNLLHNIAAQGRFDACESGQMTHPSRVLRWC